MAQVNQEEGPFMRAGIQEFLRRIREDEGQSLAEYALILVFVAIACVLALTSLGTAVSGPLTNVTGTLAAV